MQECLFLLHRLVLRLKSKWVFFECFLDDQLSKFPGVLRIMTAVTGTVDSTNESLCKTLAIQSKTLRLFAMTGFAFFFARL